MLKPTCIVDACSYLNLLQVDHNDGSLLDMLQASAQLTYSPTVNQEITRAVRKPGLKRLKSRMPEALRRHNAVYRPTRRTYDEYYGMLFDPTDQKDMGEKNNLAVGIDRFVAANTGVLIFLTDDNRAIRGCLNGVIESFPFMVVWDSFDVILFLFARQRQFTLDMAKQYLRSLNANLARKEVTSDTERTRRKKEDRIRKLATYEGYLEVVSAVK
jgi:hypothetical protein